MTTENNVLVLSAGVAGFRSRAARWTCYRLTVSGPTVWCSSVSGADCDTTEPACAVGRSFLTFVSPIRLATDRFPSHDRQVALTFVITNHRTETQVASGTIRHADLLEDVRASSSCIVQYELKCRSGESFTLFMHANSHDLNTSDLWLHRTGTSQRTMDMMEEWSFSLGTRGLLNTSEMFSQWQRGSLPMVLTVYCAYGNDGCDVWIPVYRSKVLSAPENSRPLRVPSVSSSSRNRQDVPLLLEVVTFRSTVSPAGVDMRRSFSGASATFTGNRPSVEVGCVEVTLSELRSARRPEHTLHLRDRSSNTILGYIRVHKESPTAGVVGGVEGNRHFVLDVFMHASGGSHSSGVIQHLSGRNTGERGGPGGVGSGMEHEGDDASSCPILVSGARSILGAPRPDVPPRESAYGPIAGRWSWVKSDRVFPWAGTGVRRAGFRRFLPGANV